MYPGLANVSMVHDHNLMSEETPEWQILLLSLMNLLPMLKFLSITETPPHNPPLRTVFPPAERAEGLSGTAQGNMHVRVDVGDAVGGMHDGNRFSCDLDPW